MTVRIPPVLLVEYCDDGGTTPTCQRFIPALVSPFLMELYNNYLAPGGGLPRIDRWMLDRVRGLAFHVRLGESYVGRADCGGRPACRPRTVTMRLAGLSRHAVELGVTVPLEYVRRWNQEYGDGDEASLYSSVAVKASSESHITAAVAELRRLGYEVPSSRAQQAGLTITIIAVLLGLTSALIILVAAVNIAHTFFSLVHERREEIGLYRALGASRGDVRNIVLAEAGVVGFGAGVLGLGLALAGARLCDLLWQHYVPSFPFQALEFVFFLSWAAGGRRGLRGFLLSARSLPAGSASRPAGSGAGPFLRQVEKLCYEPQARGRPHGLRRGGFVHRGRGSEEMQRSSLILLLALGSGACGTAESPRVENSGDGDVSHRPTGKLLADSPFPEVRGGPWRLDDEAAVSLALDDGALVLVPQQTEELSVWIANTGESTVSRLDAETGREVARYPSVLVGGDHHGQSLSAPCQDNKSGNCPSRTAIDFRGNCYVANRSFGHQGTVTKIAGRLADCRDRNGDGTIQTSRDVDGDGTIDLNDPEEFFPRDECVWWTVDVGDVEDIPRALAIAPDPENHQGSGNIWVGLNRARAAVELDPNGQVVRTVDLPLQPYGAAAARTPGVVWFTSAAWQDPSRHQWFTDPRYADNPPAIVAVDFTTGEVGERILVAPDAPCQGSYGITVDPKGRVWVGAEQCGAVFGYDPEVGVWQYVDLTWSEAPFALTRGIVAGRDGRIWVAHSHCTNNQQPDCGFVTSFAAQGGRDQVHYPLPNAIDSIGMDLDGQERVWVVNRRSNNASRIDPRGDPHDERTVQTFPTGREPYTYSDFTGYGLVTQFPRGVYRGRVERCRKALWHQAHVVGAVPEGTAVELRLRLADTEEELSEAPWEGPWSTYPVALHGEAEEAPVGRFLEYELTLTSENGDTSPRVNEVAFYYQCPLI